MEEGEHVPNPDQKSILDIVDMRVYSRCDVEEVASFSVDRTIGEALNGSLKRCEMCFKPMLCW